MKKSFLQNNKSKPFWTAKLLVIAAFIAVLYSTPSTAFLGIAQQFSADPLIVETNLRVARKGHTATQLNDGRVLIAGGENGSGLVSDTEVLDPAAAMSSSGPGMGAMRAGHTAILLGDGRVLIAGGQAGGQRLTSTELFDPTSNSIHSGPSMVRGRAGHAGLVLPDGRYLLVGGDDLGTAEIYDPAAQSFTTLGNRLRTPRSSHSMALLKNGQVLIAGGLSISGQALTTAEIFDPATLTFSPVPSPMQSPRTNPTLRVLPDGKVQVIGGDDESTMEMYNADGQYFIAYTHLVNGIGSLGKLLRTPGRKALLNLDPQRSGLQAAASGLSGDALAALTDIAERADYSLTGLDQSQKVVLAGGGTNSAVATSSAYLINDSSNATITVDKTDYHPGETVIITGSGFQPGETVDFLMHVEPLTAPDTALTQSVADASGNFVNTTFIVRDSDANVTLTLTATGESSGLVAQTIFTDVISCNSTTRPIISINLQSQIVNVNQSVIFSAAASMPANAPTTFSSLDVAWSYSSNGGSEWNSITSGVSKSFSNQNRSLDTNLNFTANTSDNSNQYRATFTASYSVNPPNTCTSQTTATLTVNAPSTGTLEVKKALNPTGDLGRFNLQINSTTVGTGGNVGNAGTTGVVTENAGSYAVGEVAVAGTNLSDYDSSISCTDDTTSIGPASGPSLSNVTVSAGKAMVCTITNTRIIPSLQLTKTGTLDMTVAAPNNQANVGDKINYTITATNNGTVTLTGVTISDTKVGVLSCAWPGAMGTLSPNQSAICTGSYNLTQADIDFGKVDNTANANCSQNTQATATASVVVPQTPKLSLTKTGTLDMTVVVPNDQANVGDKINYIITATNNGNVTLTGVTVSDTKVTSLSCTWTGIAGALSPNQSASCIGSYTLTQADIDLGKVDNTANANGSQNSQATATASVVVPQTPKLSLSKNASPTSYSSIDQIISYSYTLTNCGNVTLAGPFTVSDDHITASVACGSGPLAPEATATCKASYAITQPDLNAGSVTNHATATNGSVVSNQAQATVTANLPPISSSCVSISAIQGVAITLAKMTASGGTGLGYSFSASGFPAGLSMAPDGTISGTPTVNGTFKYTVTITDSGNNTGTINCSMTVSLPPITSGCLNFGATQGVAIAPIQMVAIGGAGGPYTFFATGLPTGLSMAASGTISGTPSVNGTFDYTVTIADVLHNGITFGCSVTVLAPITSNCVSLNAMQGVAITPVQMSASGGTGTGYTFTVIGLPSGLSMTSDGTIYGTPIANGTFNYTVTIKDSAGNTGASNCSITVYAPLSYSCVNIKAIQGVGIAPVQMTVSGGSGGYTFSASSLPDGLSMASDGWISGTPTVTGTFSYTVTITDSGAGIQGTLNCSVTVYSPISSSCVSINAIQGSEITPVQMTANGVAGGPFTFSATELPAGLSMAANGTISGTPTVSGTSFYTVTITDGAGNQGEQTCSVKVYAPITSSCVSIDAIQGSEITPVKLTASGGADKYTFSANGLPAGLSMDADGTISGTPTVNGTFNYTVTITDNSSNQGKLNCSITVLPPITSNCISINAFQGVAIAPAQMMASGGAGGTYTFSAAGLPDGIKMSGDGIISGIPEEKGIFTYTITITDSANNKGSSSCSITVAEPQHPNLALAKTANPTTYKNAAQTISYTYVLTNAGNVSLSGPFTITDDKLGTIPCGSATTLAPRGSVNCSKDYAVTKEDLIEGSITNVAYGHANFFNQDIDSNKATATVVASIPPLSLSCAGGYAPVGKPYTFSLTVNGGVLPYNFSITSGSLPPGLSLNADTGAITGTPTVAGSFNFTVQVVDYRGNSAGTVARGCGAILTYQESMFVIWGGNPTIPAGQPANVTIGQDYPFWGAQWAKQVLGGNWTANPSFKGYADSADLVHKVWTTRPGNSSKPPDSVGSYIGVIITTQTTKQGSTISGNIAEIGILKVDDPSAYGPNPGHSGSGVLVAIVP